LNETVLQGLYITVAGMGLVFAALGLLLLAMVALDRAFRPRPADLLVEEAGPEVPEEDLALVAAVGLALALAEAEGAEEGASPEVLPPGRGWILAGRSRQVTVWRRGGKTGYRVGR